MRQKTKDAARLASKVSRLGVTQAPRLASRVSRLKSSPWLDRAREVFDVEIAGLKKTRASIGPSFVAAVKLISSTVKGGGIVVVTGVGKNLHVAEKMSAIFSSTGTRSIVLNPVQAMHGDLGMTSARDVLLALSFSGESDEVLRLIPAIRRHGLKVISMTGDPKSSLAKLSDIHIEIPCGKEACPFGMAPTNSVTSTLAMGDALAMVLLGEQKFTVEDYAGNHPAGAIGRALVLKVSDIMRTGDALALVKPTATVMEAALAMTNSKGGSAIVVDRAGKLAGIFTDGDLRRTCSNVRMFECSNEERKSPGVSRGKERKATIEQSNNRTFEQSNIRTFEQSNNRTIEQSNNRTIEQSNNRTIEQSNIRTFEHFFAMPVSRYMTKSPSFVYDDAYAAELLKVFEKKRIDDLPVCDRKGRVVGLVDLQDLPKMKVL